ncbi:MAG: DNA translocase FtsK [Anaerolineaceae bacterium]
MTWIKSVYLHIVDFFRNFKSFYWDMAGIAMIALALILGLGFLGLTNGSIITPLVLVIAKWLGWGSAILVVVLVMLGVLSIRIPTGQAPHPRLVRVLELEGAFFSLLMVLTIIGGSSVDRAEAGKDGGMIGWGLIRLLSDLLTPVGAILVTILLFMICVLFGFGLEYRVFLRLGWLSAVESQRPTSPVVSIGEEPILPVTPVIQQVGDRKESPTSVRQKVKRGNSGVIPVNSTAEGNSAARHTSFATNRDRSLPPLTLLLGDTSNRADERHINMTAALIEKTLAEFGVPAKVVGYRTGPTVTQFAVEPGFIERPGTNGEGASQKVRVAQISVLSRDLALALSARQLRIEAPVPGRSYVGIEVPNSRSTQVRLRSILESDAFRRMRSPLAIALGRDVSGQPVVADLSNMPHLLIAGTTGSGKSVCIAALTTCLVMGNTPEELRLIMIDPKRVELVRFNNLPHLYGKVETDLERILIVLRWVVNEMERRYKLLEDMRAKDIDVYNQKIDLRETEKLPRLVVLIDELADLMMSAPVEAEQMLTRLAQKARATGIHLVVATQRPSTEVVTGVIKANFPARISFATASSIDSRVILDTTGAEDLLGRGDMLYLNPETGAPLRSQGVLVTDEEVDRIIAYWQENTPRDDVSAPWEGLAVEEEDTGSDALIARAVDLVRHYERASASLLQRRLRIGYPRAARLMDELEDMGVVGPSLGGGKDREVLMTGADDSDTES